MKLGESIMFGTFQESISILRGMQQRALADMSAANLAGNSVAAQKALDAVTTLSQAIVVIEQAWNDEEKAFAKAYDQPVAAERYGPYDARHELSDPRDDIEGIDFEKEKLN